MDIQQIVEELSNARFDFLHHNSRMGVSMPSIEKLQLLVEKLKSVLFPGYFGNSDLSRDTQHFYLGVAIDEIHSLLAEQIRCGSCFECGFDENKCLNCKSTSVELATLFMHRLSDIKMLLSTDVKAAFYGDPAAKTFGETIFCYPSINVMTHFRIAHELAKIGSGLIARIITEIAHSKTGIDIHPNAQIGKYFFIDHGTGVVIGETTIIGSNVRLYQGVTLGAKSFPVDKNGNPIKGVSRHPIIEDDVIIYSNSTILGRITIGKGSIIGGNMWITDSVAPDTKMYRPMSE